MNRLVLEKLKKDKLFDYFKLNSFYIKELNRNPFYYETLKKILKEKYNLRITDKMSNVINDLELVSSIISTIN